MTDFTPVLVLAVIFGGIIGIIKVGSESRLRHRLIEKGLVDEKAQYLWSRSGDGNLSNLKWGMVLVAIGIAALVCQFLPYDMDNGGLVGLMFICGGLAFLIYYPIAQRHLQQSQHNPLPPQH
jgi:hypothetical protein